MASSANASGKKWLPWLGCGGCGCLVLVLGLGATVAFGSKAFFPDQADEDAQYLQGRTDAAEYQGRPIDDCFDAAVARAGTCDATELVSCIRRPEGMFAQCMASAAPDPTFCQRYQEPNMCEQACQRHRGGYTCDFFCGRVDSLVAEACAPR